MLNLKEIRLEGSIIKARVEPWAEEDRSFDIEVDADSREIVRTSLNDDAIEKRMYAGKARYKLCTLYDKAHKSNSKMPQHGSVVTH